MKFHAKSTSSLFPLRWKRPAAITALAMVLATLGLWQTSEYFQERELAREMLHRQAHSVMNALVGGIQAHRRRGNFFVEQLQGSLEGLVSADDILAVAITSEDGQLLLSAGEVGLLTAPVSVVAGDFWDATGFRLVEPLELPSASGGLRERTGGGRGGQGRGRGPFGELANFPEGDSPFPAGGTFAAILILDRTQVDARCRRAAWLRGSVFAAGALLLLGVTLAWQITVRAAGRARMLEVETRHLRDLSQAAAGLAHETRNPLGLIRGWAQRLAQEGFPSPKQQEQVERIVEECDRVTARINQFLAFARPQTPVLETVHVQELAHELAILLEPDLVEKELTIDSQSLAADAVVQADREMLRQALFNLVQNAIHAAPAGTAVEILWQLRQDGTRRIEVADRGEAVPDDAVDSLFTPYFTTRPDGTGLGLAIIRHLAGLHGWECGYTPRPGGGAIFWLDGLHG